jgi:hypothetical protein
MGSIDYRSVDQQWLRKLPRETAEELLVLPLRVLNGSLEIACVDPAKPGIKQRLEELLGCTVSLRIASESNLRHAIGNAYLSRDGKVGPLLGELLVETHAITPLDLDRALEIQKLSGRKLGEILQDMGLITPEMLAATLHKQEQLQYVSEK